MCFVNVQSSLHENVVCARIGNAAYIIIITCIISCDVAVMVRSHKKISLGNFLRGGEGDKEELPPINS